jgi:miniconductance mechanosensitive channel
VLRLIRRLVARSPIGEEAGAITRIVRRLANLVPTLIIAAGILAVPHLPAWAPLLARNLATGFAILTVALAIGAAMDLGNQLYARRAEAVSRPIKGYVQVGKIAIFCIATILIIAALIDRSPILLLSGLGAMAAVLMLVFKDTILSLVASVQLASNDMLRVGDWIEMPQLGADGDVVDIALHTVKVQNWDKTITTIPTHRLISESYRNWRGMYEAGGRRIKRSLMIDQNSVRFLGDGEVARLRRFALLGPYLDGKQAELAEWNAAHPDRADEAVNARRLTNIGTFRAYVGTYLRDRGDLTDKLFLMVRQLAPTEHGLPLEIYAFVSDTGWAAYEGTQADIFDHLIAILPEFGLRLFQQPTGLDVARALGGMREAA